MGERRGTLSLFAILIDIMDTLGPLKEDKNENSFVIVIMDIFQTNWTISGKEYLQGIYPCAFTMGISILGVPKEIRSDGVHSLRPRWQRTSVPYSTMTI